MYVRSFCIFLLTFAPNMTELRDYQQQMKDRLYDSWTRQQSVMVQMPTGTGKTHLMAKVIDEKEDGGVLIVAHRIELIDQISQTLDTFGVRHGMIDRWTKDLGSVTADHKVIVASIQTLSRRIDHINFTPSIIVIDEAHHAVAQTYRLLWDKWPKAKFLGLTATPCRLNQTGFTDLFDVLLQSWPLLEFIDKGWLSDFEYISVAPGNKMVEKIAGLKKRGVDGDYQTKEMATVMDIPESIAHLYDTYEQFAKGKKGIVYAISREHAKHISEYYTAKGVSCCWIESKTPADERQRLVDGYRQGKIDVIANVDIFSEGFDCPEVEFIQLARPTLSLSKYLQQVGRGMRCMPNKDCVIILDQVGMYQTFGIPTDERDWGLMFRGKIAGKGHQGGEHGFVIREENDKELVNLQMVRIKSRGQEAQHVEVFIENGKYGILRDRQVSCPAQFVSIQRLDPPFFALATYPYEIYRNRMTAINSDGRDYNLQLFGHVRQEEEWLVYKNNKGQTTWWDSIGGRTYQQKPKFEKIGPQDVVKVGDQYMLRKQFGTLDVRFTKEQVLTGPIFCIYNNLLVFNDLTRVHKVVSIRDTFVAVVINKWPNRMFITADGSVVDWKQMTPEEIASESLSDDNLKSLGLRRLKEYWRK